MPNETDITETNDSTASSLQAMEKLVFSLPVDHDGTSIYVKGWHKEGNNGFPIIIIHDFGETISNHRVVCQLLAESGHNVYAFDLRGHGRSGKNKSQPAKIRTYVNDLLQISAWVKHQEKNRIPIILANGIGGKIALAFCQKHPNFCKGIVLAAPVTQLKNELSEFKFTLIKIANEFFPLAKLPRFLVPKIYENKLSADSEKSLLKPQLPLFTISLTLEILKKIRSTKIAALSYSAPILILCPEDDHICNYKKLKKYVAMHERHNLRLIDLPNCGHNIFTDDSGSIQVAMGHIKQWLKDFPGIEGQLANRQTDMETPTEGGGETSMLRPGTTKKPLIQESTSNIDEL